MAPFVAVAILGYRRYGARFSQVRLKPFFIRILSWHLIGSFFAVAIYAFAAGRAPDGMVSTVARGCGQGLSSLDPELLDSCPEFLIQTATRWGAGSCIFFGAIGLLIILMKRKKRRR